MRPFIIASSLAALLALDAYSQNTNVAFIPGKLAVFRGGDGILTIASDRQHPAFIDEYDPAITNQITPIISIELPTNGANSIWFNAHAGSEGQGLTRSADRQYLTMTGYCGDLNSIPGTPSSATNNSGQGYDRGFGLIDAFTNFNVTYHSPYWFGLLPGITQNNPRGIATDGSNDFWGCGTVAGTATGSFAETGTLYWGGGGEPSIVQNYVDSAYSMKIINGVLYMVAQNETGGAQNNGVYNFVDINNNPAPLPDAGNNIVTYYTNLFLNFGATYSHIETFDMNPAGTIAYAADETYGIVKFVNSGGTWTSPYYFNSNNIGSAGQPKGATGCFGIAVDFSGTNPVIYATTMDEGDGANTCSNRLISLVDNGAPDPGAVLAQTLATASNINEVFRGVDFTPDLTPLITSQPVNQNVITNSTASFSVGVQSVYPVTYQWQVNGSNVVNGGGISGATNSTLSFVNTVTNFSGNYDVVITNQYGSVTSTVANLFVSLVPIPPTITNGVKYVTNFIGNNQAFSVSPQGTPPFAYQWYYANTNLGITQLVDGSKYAGSTNSSVVVSNLQLTDSGSYYIVVTNQAQNGQISNLISVLTVVYLPPSIPSNGQPGNVTMLQGQTTALTVSSAVGTQPLSYQWYQGSLSNPLGNTGEFSGAEANALTIAGATLNDAANYFCVVSNAGGSATSQSASVTVIVPPALSYVGYSNQVYVQNFNSLPNPGTTNVNTVVGFQTIGGITYGVANPFDFAYPVYTNVTAGASGGLNLAATMPGWYGECDAQTAATGAQLGAADGSTTTGGIYSFGTTNAGTTGDRALGLIATSSSGGTHFGLKLINQSSNNLSNISLQYTGEFWKTGTKPKTMTFSYAIDPTGNNSTLSSSEILASSNNLVSSLYVTFPTAGKVGATNGHLAINQKNLAVTNLALSSAWQPGYALWLVWSINDPTGSGQGYGIDNFSFYSSSTTNLTQAADFTVNGVVYSSGSGLGFGFATAPFDSAKFSVRATTNLTTPLSQWLNLGHPTEVSFGQYQFTDAQARTNAQTFYTVTSP
jgi:hypothetical protein